MLSFIQEKIFDLSELQKKLAIWKFAQHKLVFTNGCFDLLHLGHLHYLAEARAMGDKLIIGVNTDQSVSRIKGESRPIKDEGSRCLLLASLQFVDAVILFDEETPLNLIKEVQPDILVKGADYELNQIVGSDVVLSKGGLVKTIAFKEGYSTSKLVDKIKKHL